MAVLTALAGFLLPSTGQTQESCKDAEKGIVYYRTQVWTYQDELGELRSPTTYPEQKRNACVYKRWRAGTWKTSAQGLRRKIDRFQIDRGAAICYVFGQYCAQALSVARCESGPGYSINAQNGQYLGMFQMGEYARSRYGHSNTAVGQARSAHAYFVASGRDWSPWSCKPW